MNLYQFGELWGTALQDAGVVSCFYRQASYNQQFGEPSEGIGWGRRTDWGEAVPGQPWWVRTSFYGQSPAAGHKRFKKHRYGGNPFLHCWIWWVLFPESRIMPSLDLPSGYPSPRNDCVCWPPDRQTLFTQMNKINSPKKLKKTKAALWKLSILMLFKGMRVGQNWSTRPRGLLVLGCHSWSFQSSSRTNICLVQSRQVTCDFHISCRMNHLSSSIMIYLISISLLDMFWSPTFVIFCCLMQLLHVYEFPD